MENTAKNNPQLIDADDLTRKARREFTKRWTEEYVRRANAKAKRARELASKLDIVTADD